MRDRAAKVGLLEEYDTAYNLMKIGRGNSDYNSVVVAIKESEKRGYKCTPMYSSKVVGTYISQYHGIKGRDF